MDADDPAERPVLKLSRCSRRKPEVPLKAARADRNKSQSKRRRSKASVPIPSFSPVDDDLADLDTSILDSPVVKKKEDPKPIVWEDDDDDDDEILLAAPPIFGTAKPNQKPEKEHTKEVNQDVNSSSFGSGTPAVRRMTIDKDADNVERSSIDNEDANSDKLPFDVIRTVDALLENVDSTKATIRDISNMVLSECGDSDKMLGKLIHAHVKTRMSEKCNEEAASTSCAAQDQAQAATESCAAAIYMTTGGEGVDAGPATGKRSKTRTCKPDKDALVLSIDNLYIHADPSSVLVRDIIIALEVEYGAKLDKASRALVRTHLKALVSGKVEPTVSLETDPVDAMALPDEGTLNPPIGSDVYIMEGDDDVTAEVSMELHREKESSTVSRVKRSALTGALAADAVHVDVNMVSEDRQVDPGEEPDQNACVERPPAVPKPSRKPRAKKRSRQPKIAEPYHDIESTEQTDGLDVPTDSCGNQDQMMKELPESPTRKPAKRPRTRAKKGNCALCSTCSCTINHPNEDRQLLNGLSMTDPGIERALIQRAKTLEKTVDKYESMLDQVKRELKKHRRAIWKKQEAELNDVKQYPFGNSRFLPDADVWDEQALAVEQKPLSGSVVHQAQETLFVSHANYQPTLTQMLGGSSRKKEEAWSEQNDPSVDPPMKDAAVLDLCSPTVTDEENEEVPDGASEDDCVDDVPEAAPVDHVHRLSWRAGSKVEPQSPLLRGSGVWSALTTVKGASTADEGANGDNLTTVQSESISSCEQNGPRKSTSADNKYSCAWDAMFSEHIGSDDEMGMHQLLDLLQAEIMDDDDVVRSSQPAKDNAMSSQRSSVELPLLTQRGENLAESIEDKIMSDPMRMQAVEALCPNWRENIRYALVQRGKDEVRQALDKVRQSMKNLNAMRENASTLWKRQEIVLSLFEMSLSESLSRLTTAGSQSSQSIDVAEAKTVQTFSDTDTAAPNLSPISEGDEKSQDVESS